MVPIKRECDVETVSDFARYYQASWVGWHPSDSTQIMPCQVGRMAGDNSVIFTPMVREKGAFKLNTHFCADWDTIKSKIDFGCPDIGTMPQGPTFAFCSYTSPRVAKKGFRPGDIRRVEFNTWEMKSRWEPSQHPSNRLDWVWHAFNPEYESLAQAEQKLTAGDVLGVMLSRNLGIYTLPRVLNSLLAYKRWQIGHVVNPFLVKLQERFGDYEHDIAMQTGVEVIVG